MSDRTTITDEDLERMTSDQEIYDEPAAGHRRWPWFVAAGVLVAGAVGTWLVFGDSSSGDDAVTAQQLQFAEVVRTDLIEVTTLDGTLGRSAGDTIASAIAGTVTAAPEPGTTVEPGGVLFEIDAEPVILMQGVSPAYRDLTISDETSAVTSRSNGTITSVIAEGTVIEQGDVLYEVNGEPVVALYGDVPAYRTLRDAPDNLTGDDVLQLETALVELGYDPGNITVDDEFTDFTETMVEDWQKAVGAEEDGVVDLGEVVFIPGPTEVVDVQLAVGDTINDGKPVLTIAGSDNMEGDDVLQLEEGLSALGFDPGPVDGVFDSATKAAVIEWQAATGLEADGVVNLGEVIFADGSVRISGLTTEVGSPVNPGGPVLNVTSSDIVVTALLPANDQDILEVGVAVEIELPDNSTTTGVVDEIDSVATVSQGSETVFKVTILLDDPSVVGTLDEAPVDVNVVTDSVSNVVAVPVTALLALSEGGYAVEVDAGNGQTRLVAVDPGFFADGLVEVDSSGLEPGDRVVIP